MSSRNPVKLALLALSAIPFAVKTAYLERAWVSSPIDRLHLGLYGTLALLIVFVVVVAKLHWRFLTVKPLAKSRSLRLMVVPVALYVIGLIWDVNALQLIASVGILWTAAWALYGRVSGLMLAPAAVCAVLAVPGSLYWLGNASSALRATPNAAFAPEFSPRSQKGMLGRSIPPTAGFTRFFRTSDAQQFIYADASNEVSVLAVKVGRDIHEIHPATHCLRSGGWYIESERIITVPHPLDGGTFEVDEAVASAGAKRMLTWIWYSSAEKSTGSFLHFRRMYSTKTEWHTYQVATGLEDGEDSESAARARLSAFLARGIAP